MLDDGTQSGGGIGLNVGQKDLPLTDVRRIVPPYFIVGVSTNNPDEALKQNATAPLRGRGDIFGTRLRPARAPRRPSASAR